MKQAVYFNWHFVSTECKDSILFRVADTYIGRSLIFNLIVGFQKDIETTRNCHLSLT